LEKDTPEPIPGVRVRSLWTRRKRRSLNFVELRILSMLIRPDVVHSHWAPYGYAPLQAGLKPLVVTAWGSDVLLPESLPPETRSEMDLALTCAQLVTCDSHEMRKVILQRTCGKGRVEVVQWGVDTQMFRPGLDVAELRRELSLGSGPVVFYPRQLDPVYNPDTALQAIPGVLEAFPDARFIFKHYIQEPERVAEIKQLAARLGIADEVRFLDSVPYETMAKLYALADVMVSVPSSDGTPMSLLESMAAGAVPLVSDLPSLREWIADGVNGRMVPARNVEALTQALIELLGDPETRQRMRAHNFDLVKERADQKNEMLRMESIYESLAG
jgi:glycosyltransferase involved in cell wall biosynthesis